MDFSSSERNFRLLRIDVYERLTGSNEAAVRLYFINKLIEDCLGWPIKNVDPERYLDGDYADYELGDPAKRVLIEAKRAGEYFTLPAEIGVKPASLQALFKGSPSFEAAVTQAIRYCKDRSIPIGVVCNGLQLGVFLGCRLDGVPPEEGRAVVFDSLDMMEQEFRLLWDLLSPEGVRAREAFRILSNGDFSIPPSKLSSCLANYPGYKNRNPVATDLQILGGLFLEDIASIDEFREDFVKDTYCSSGALSQYALVSKEILSVRYNAYFQSEQGISATSARNKKGINSELKQDLISGSLTSRPILLVGDRGVGKSMFINHLVMVDAKDQLTNAVVLRVDFGSKPSVADDLEAYVREEIERQLYDDYQINIIEDGFVRRVYKGELRKFEVGIFGPYRDSNPGVFWKRSWSILAH